MKKREIIATILILVCTTSLYSKTDSNYPDWSKKTHSNLVEPNYKEVFASSEVKRIDIKLSRESWDAMWADLDANLGGNRGGMGGGEMQGGMMGGRMGGGEMQGGMMGGRMGGGEMQGGMMGGRMGGGEMQGGMMGGRMGGGEMQGGEMQGGRMGGGMPGGMGGAENDFSPMWAPCTITYNGKEWYEVGVRFKGNSSLMRAHQDGNKKLSLKLDFDEYEKEYPELKNQRFYGFKKLNLNSNFDDASFSRELIATQLFSDFGMTVSRSVPCEVYIDLGEGAQYYGLYTLLEEVDESVIATHYVDDSGNIYKPEERAGSFAEGTFNPDQLHRKGGKESDSYDDVESLYNIINSPERLSNETKWRKDLEAIFDVDVFLKWLAVTTTIQNWDIYGNMAHNYYLYNNPENNKLTWIPWDHNEAFKSGRNAFSPANLGAVSSQWPLISYIIGVEDYKSRYNDYLREFVDTIFTESKLTALYDSYYKLLKESIYKELSMRTYIRYYKEFDENIASLKEYAKSRIEIARRYLADPSIIEPLEQEGGGGRMIMPGGEGGSEGGRGNRMMPPMQEGENSNMPQGGMMQGGMPQGGMMRGGMMGGGPMATTSTVEGEPLPLEGDGLQNFPPMMRN